MTTLSTTEPLPTSSNNNTSNKFALPPDWVTNEMQMMRRVEHLQAAIVDLSRNAMQIITWSEMIQEGIDEMQKSISISSSTEEEEPEPEEEQQEEQDYGTATEARTTKTKARLSISSNPIL